MNKSKTSKTESPVASELLGKLTRYTALAGAAGLGSAPAGAAITVWNSGESITGLPSNGHGGGTPVMLYFEFETGTVQRERFTGEDFYLGVVFLSSTARDLKVNFFSAMRNASENPENLVQTSNVYPARLASGDPIGPAQGFAAAYSTMASGVTYGATSFVFGKWAAGGRGYLGFKFDISGETHYGWAEVTLENILPKDGLPKLTLNRFAYNTTADEGLLAGQTVVPEPESALPMALLVLGAAGLGRYRRQRAAQAGPDGEKTAA